MKLFGSESAFLMSSDSSFDFLLKPIFLHGFSASLHMILLLFLLVIWAVNRVKEAGGDGSKERLRQRKVSLYKQTLACCFVVSAFNIFLCLFSYFYWYRNGWSEDKLVTLSDYVVKTLAWGSTCVYLHCQFSNYGEQQRFPLLLRIWWGFYFSISCYCLVIDVVLKKHVSFPSQHLVSDVFSVITGLFLGVVGFFARNEGENTLLEEPLLNGDSSVSNGVELNKEKGGDTVTPYSNAGIFSILTFSWMGTIIAAGNKKTLDLEDVPQLDAGDSAFGAFPSFRNRLEEADSEGTGVTSLKLAKALFFSAWKDILWTALFALPTLKFQFRNRSYSSEYPYVSSFSNQTSLPMATPVKSNSRLSVAMERTGQWVFSQEIPTDVVVEVGEANFNLHKFMLVAKSNYIRKLIMETKEADLTRINLSEIPGGPEIFEKAAKFCYGVNFEITVHNVAALRCAAEYLQMTDKYCDSNLAGRTEDFLSQVALSSLSGAVVVLKSCEDLLPMAEELKIVQRCIDVASARACSEASFPCRTPPNWWTEELSILDVELFGRIIGAMKQRGAKALTLATALITYAERWLRDLVRDHSGKGIKCSEPTDSDLRIQQRELLESIVALLPAEKAAFPIHFLCCLLRCAIFLKASSACKNELEKRISVILEHVTVDDLLVLSFTYDGERLLDLDSVRRIVAGFVEKEKSMAVFNGGDFREVSSSAMQRVAKTVDAYLAEIATVVELTISKFNGIANLVPKGARKVEDDLYRAIDIYLKAHSNLDEIEREKVCSSMDPLKLSYEARVHASQNKRLPVQIVLHALYYDQLKLRSGGVNDRNQPDAVTTRNQLQADVSLVKENEALRSELMKMKMYIADLQKNNQAGTSSKSIGTRKPTFFSSMSKTLGKLNPFRHGSKDTSHIDDSLGVDVTKPRRRRFSIS